MTMPPLTYDTVMVTRNRSEALALSIPLLLNQSRQPEKIIVVDSSDEPDVVKGVIAKIASASDIPIELFHTDAGTSLQRNLGLSKVTADIVFFLMTTRWYYLAHSIQ